MPPKKGFSRKVEYASRNIHDDFLEQLTKSTSESAQMKKIITMNSRIHIVDGLYDKGNWTRDVITSKTWLQLFKKWFSESKFFAPMEISRILIWVS